MRAEDQCEGRSASGESFEGKPAIKRRAGGAVQHRAEGGAAASRHDRPGRKSGGWISSAVKSPGSFTKSAEKAGKSVHEYAQEEKHAPGKTGKRARLALTFEGMRKK